MRPYVVLFRAGWSAAVGLVVLLGGPRRWRHRAAVAGFPDAASWRAGAWLATPLGLLLAIFWLDLVLAGLMGVLMPALWALEGDGELWYQWVVVDDLAGAFFAVPVGVLMVWLAVRLAGPLVAAERWRTRWLLGPTAGERIEWLTATRSQALDASAVELRRIERDLHDGAQAQLVALSLQLGMAEDLFDRDPTAARGLLVEARAGAETTMAELRALVRGIHPPLLAERGLAGALEALALRSGVECRVALTRRLPAPVESALYFTAVELVANAVRHSGASRIEVRLDDGVVLRVVDDGRGGADPGGGSGLRGLRRRLAPFDGVLTVSSPIGGGTVATVELPCASS
ncbi:signal transduction histidine kinase [Solirubrobacter pauli]|uniref:histidine kinase n=1 Tax=Solirubrobacter pauli TaxID=166793 RepID=A0A660L9P0_9ACTN|nr:histidine kinase [Solirubrobacter pauli]RKQ91797.1 signal transduction histidine kinase [Solirubrobacter pauli]